MPGEALAMIQADDDCFSSSNKDCSEKGKKANRARCQSTQCCGVLRQAFYRLRTDGIGDIPTGSLMLNSQVDCINRSRNRARK